MEMDNKEITKEIILIKKQHQADFQKIMVAFNKSFDIIKLMDDAHTKRISSLEDRIKELEKTIGIYNSNNMPRG